MDVQERLIRYAAAISAMLLCGASHATLTEFTDRDDYFAEVANQGASLITIDFAGFAPGTIITNQYAGLGVTFTDGTDFIIHDTAFKEDGEGLGGGALILRSTYVSTHR